jgi:hypothetical protein
MLVFFCVFLLRRHSLSCKAAHGPLSLLCKIPGPHSGCCRRGLPVLKSSDHSTEVEGSLDGFSKTPSHTHHINQLHDEQLSSGTSTTYLMEEETPHEAKKPLDNILEEKRLTRKRELEAWREMVGSLDCKVVTLAAETFESTEEEDTPYEEENPLDNILEKKRRTKKRELEAWRELVGSLDCEGVVRLAGEKSDSSEEEETPQHDEEKPLDTREEKRRRKRELETWRQLIKESEMITPSSGGPLLYDAGKVAHSSPPSPALLPGDSRKKRELEAWRQTIKESEMITPSLSGPLLYDVGKVAHSSPPTPAILPGDSRKRRELEAWRQTIKESEMITPSSSGSLQYDAGKVAHPSPPSNTLRIMPAKRPVLPKMA